MKERSLKDPLLKTTDSKSKDRYSASKTVNDDPMSEPFEHVTRLIRPTTPNPFAKASFWSKRFYTWTNAYFDMCDKGPVKNADLLTYGQTMKTEHLEKEFNEAKNKKGNENLTDIQLSYKVIKSTYNKGMAYYITSSFLEFAIPLMVSKYLAHMGDWDDGPEIPYIHEKIKDYYRFVWPSIYLIAITFTLLLRFFLINGGLYWMKFSRARLGTLLRMRIMEKLKCIQLSRIDTYSESSILNMLTTDIDNLASGLLIKPDLVSSCIILTTGFLIFYLGIDSGHMENKIEIYILVIFIIGMIFNRIFRNKTVKIRHSMLAINDYKCKLIRNTFRQIWQIKSSETEPIVYEHIIEHHLMQNELKLSYLRWDVAAQLAATLLPTLFAAVIFGAYFFDDSSQDFSQKTGYLILTMLSIVKKPINSISRSFRMRPVQRASLDRIVAFADEDDRVTPGSSEASGLRNACVI